MAAIEVKFWDGHRMYEGHVRELSEAYVVAQIRVFDEKDHTILPQTDILDTIISHLSGRVVPLEIGMGQTRADILSKLENIERVPDNPRRLDLTAVFRNPGAREKSVLARLIGETRKRAQS